MNQPKFEDKVTERGFQYVEFLDGYQNKCSLQISSAVSDGLGFLWLGVDDPQPQILRSKARELGLPNSEGNGWMPYPIPEDVLLNTRMHLSEDQVRLLIARLSAWLETGSVHQ